MNLALKNDVEELLGGYIAGLKNLFPGITSNVLLYGSADIGNTKSDIDVCTIVPEYSNNQRDALATFTIEFHRRHGYRLDFDVPYENKVLYSYQDLQRAFSAAAFPVANDKFIVPVIKMEPEFLSSDMVKDRLILNALTTKHSILHGSSAEIDRFSQQAWETIIRIVFSNNGNKPISIEEFIKLLCKDPCTQKEYKEYLGYDYGNWQIRTYLDKSLKRIIPDLVKKKMLHFERDKLNCSKSWINELVGKRLEFIAQI